MYIVYTVKIVNKNNIAVYVILQYYDGYRYQRSPNKIPIFKLNYIFTIPY